MNTSCLLLGSNLGSREKFLKIARDKIDELVGKVIAFSSVFESKPWGFKSENLFLNQALFVNTETEPLNLLVYLKQIEIGIGRESAKTGKRANEKTSDRNIDIDIIFFNDLVFESAELTIPHPRFHLRKFALVPVNEILPDYIHPVLGKKVSELLLACFDRSNVNRTPLRGAGGL